MVAGLPVPPGVLDSLEEFAGEFGLLLVHRQELGGGLEVGAGQAGVGVWAVLLWRAAALSVGQGVGCSGEAVFDPLGVGGDRGRVEAELAALHVDSGLEWAAARPARTRTPTKTDPENMSTTGPRTQSGDVVDTPSRL